MNAGVQPTQLMQKVDAKKSQVRQQEMKQISEMGVYMEGQQQAMAHHELMEQQFQEESNDGESERLAIQYD